MPVQLTPTGLVQTAEPSDQIVATLKVAPPPPHVASNGVTYTPVSASAPAPGVTQTIIPNAALVKTPTATDVGTVQVTAPPPPSGYQVPTADPAALKAAQAAQAIAQQVQGTAQKASSDAGAAVDAVNQLTDKVRQGFDLINQLDQAASAKFDQVDKNLGDLTKQVSAQLAEFSKTLNLLQSTLADLSKRALLKKAPLFGPNAASKTGASIAGEEVIEG